jgi:Na+/citrate or Na+/malate symporter
MKFDSLPLSLVAAFAIGIAQLFLVAYFWAVFATHATYLPWLVAHGLTGTPLRTLVHAFVPGFVSACLMLPVAVVIARALLSRRHRSQEGAPWPST